MATKSIGSIPYGLAKRPSVPGDKESRKLIYGTVQQRDTIDLHLLASHIREHGSSFSVGTLVGVLNDMVECTQELLKQGYSVHYNGLMRLYVTGNSAGVENAEDFNPSVHFERLNLRGDVDEDVQAYLNDSPVFEYVMTRQEQAIAKKAAKAALVLEDTDTEQSETTEPGNGGSTDGGENGSSGSNSETPETPETPGTNTGGDTGGDAGGGGDNGGGGGNPGSDMD